MSSSETDRYHLTQALIDDAQERTAQIAAAGQDTEAATRLRGMLARAIVPNVQGDVVHIPNSQRDTDAIPVIVMHSGESLQFGEGFDRQTPRQTERAAAIIENWGLNPTAAAGILSKMMLTITTNYNQMPEITMHEQANGGTLTASCLFLPEDVLSGQALAKPLTAKALQISARPLVTVHTGSGAEILGHEIVHATNKIETPVRPITSQRALDMRGLREELKAYEAGAYLTMAADGKRHIAEYDLEQLLQNTQLLVEFVRAAVNARDSDPYRTPPEITTQLAGAGMPYEHLMHNRINVEAALAHLRATPK